MPRLGRLAVGGLDAGRVESDISKNFHGDARKGAINRLGGNRTVRNAGTASRSQRAIRTRRAFDHEQR